MNTKNLLLALMAAVCQGAAAATVGAHIHTEHFGSQNHLPPSLRYRDSTPGLYLRSDSGLTAGVVRNSYGRTSFYLGQTWTTSDERWSLTLGAITGYQYRKVSGVHLCMPEHKKFNVKPGEPCFYNHGKTSALLRPLIAPSWAWVEARPYLGGATPRVILLGKALSFAVEMPL